MTVEKLSSVHRLIVDAEEMRGAGDNLPLMSENDSPRTRELKFKQIWSSFETGSS